MRGSRPGATPRRSARRTGALVLVCAVAFATLAGAASAQPRQEGVALRVASQTSWLEPGGEFVLRLQIAGVPDLDETELRVVVYRRVLSRSAFTLTLRGRELGSAIRTVPPTRLSQLTFDPGGAIVIRFRPEELGLSVSGVYPVSVQVRERGGDVLDALVTHLVYLATPPDGPKLGVSLIVPVHAAGAGTAGSVPTADLRALAEALAAPAARGLPVVLAPDPATLDALAADRSPSAREVLAALRDAADGRPVAGLPYVPLSVPALLAAGLGNDLAEQRRAGAETVTRVLGLTTPPETRTWLGDEPLDDAAVERLRDLQVDRFVVREQNLEPVTLQLTLAQPFRLDTGSGEAARAVMADAGLAAHFRNTGDQVLAAHQLLADLAVLWRDAPGRERAVVVMPARRWRPNRTFLAALLDGLATSPVVQPVPLSDVFATIDPATTTRRAPLVRELATRDQLSLGVSGSAVRAVRARVDATASALPVDDPLTATLRRELLLAESADLTAAQRRNQLAAVQARLDQLAGAVALPRARTLRLTAREGEIPLTFQNRSSKTLTVLVRLESDRLEFPDGNVVSQVLPPENTTKRIAVRARTAGAFPLRVSLVTPDGGVVLAATRFTVRSTAASGVGIVLSAGAGVFLALWWARHALRGRRARRLIPA